MDEALAARVLVDCECGALRFRHGSLTEYLRQSMPPALRAAMYQHAAQTQTASGAPVERVAQLVLSALESADDWAVDWVVEHARTPALRARGFVGQLLARALRHTGVHDPRHDDLEDRLVAVHYRLGHTVWHLGFSLLNLGACSRLCREHVPSVLRPALRGDRITGLTRLGQP